MRCQIVAELATAHGGDVSLAGDMIRAAADAGADLVKLQSYTLAKLNPHDPQFDWLTKSYLSELAHEQLLAVGQQAGIEVFSTPFDAESLAMLRRLGLTRFKIASSESRSSWFDPQFVEAWVVSWPWGNRDGWYQGREYMTHLTAIPLYPTPLECVERAPLLDGWSDHCVGLAASYRAMALGAKMVEVHLALAGCSRVLPFDKSPTDIRMLRKFAEDVETMRSGVSQTFRDRWSA